MTQRGKKNEAGNPTLRAGGLKKAVHFILPFVVVVILGVAAYFVFSSNQSSTSTISNNISDVSRLIEVTRKANMLDDLLAMRPEQIAEVDIAEMNLLCAAGLPGAENLDIDYCLTTLDHWAQRVKFETERHLYRAYDPKWADHYRHSETYLRAEFLLQTLQEDLGVKYDMTAKDNFNFDDSRVAFIHGMIPTPSQSVADTTGGTCVSMPVLYVAIGHRLGYPLKLVTTESHVFVRWEGKDHVNPAWRERFNIEGAGRGYKSYEDSYYMNWPHQITEKQVRENRYLLSLTPSEELAQFLASRGHCLFDNKLITVAAQCYENAYRKDPTRPCYRNWFLLAARESDYQPVTPELARLLSRQTRLSDSRRPNVDYSRTTPRPSETTAGSRNNMSGSPDIRYSRRQHTPPFPQPYIPTPGSIQPLPR